MNNMNDIYKYIYTIIVSYPPPEKIYISFDKNVLEKDYLMTMFYQSCASMLHVPAAHFLTSMSRNNEFTPNLYLTRSNIEFLFNNNFIPQIDLSTNV